MNNKLSDTIAGALRNLDKPIDVERYRFLDTTPDLHTPILIGLGGSHAYGTNIETSDLDIRGVAMHSARDIVLGRGFEQVCNDATDTTIFSLKKVVNLLTNCNPNTIEMLGLKQEHYLYLNDVGRDLLKNKDIFLSMRCVGSFMGYANQQMYRLQQKTLVALSQEEVNAHIVKTMNGMRKMLSEQHGIKDIEVHLKDGEIVIDASMKDYPVEKLSAVLGSLNDTLRNYRRNSHRNENAMAHGKIAKHSMHLLRLYMMCEDMLLKGEVNTFRDKEHDLLMDVRNGKYIGEDGKPNSEFFDMVREYESLLDYAKEHSVLPSKPNAKRIDDFLASANMRILEEARK